MLYLIELTAITAMLVLNNCGFDKWDELLHYLGLPLEYVQQLSQSKKLEALDQWITIQRPSWEVLVSAVEKCGAIDTANNMRRELGITAPAGMLEEGNRAMTNTLLISGFFTIAMSIDQPLECSEPVVPTTHQQPSSSQVSVIVGMEQIA